MFSNSQCAIGPCIYRSIGAKHVPCWRCQQSMRGKDCEAHAKTPSCLATPTLTLLMVTSIMAKFQSGFLGQLRLYLFRESQYFLVFIHFFFIYLFYFGGVSYFLALFYLIYFETSQLSPSDSIGYAIHVTKVTLCFYVCTDLTTSRLFNENEGNGF